ncbi:hypothetical protein [Halorussus sp. AFM4]|uniref:hypothetical protein n=1 Tax=Halorussus sp. AFM4 TaxID=3421651 RepID=UPI003EC14A28
MSDTSLTAVVESVRGADEVRGVLVVAGALAALAVGYAGGSVLAGEPVESQAWLVPAVGTGVMVVLLSEYGGEA